MWMGMRTIALVLIFIFYLGTLVPFGVFVFTVFPWSFLAYFSKNCELTPILCGLCYLESPVHPSHGSSALRARVMLLRPKTLSPVTGEQRALCCGGNAWCRVPGEPDSCGCEAAISGERRASWLLPTLPWLYSRVAEPSTHWAMRKWQEGLTLPGILVTLLRVFLGLVRVKISFTINLPLIT